MNVNRIEIDTGVGSALFGGPITFVLLEDSDNPVTTNECWFENCDGLCEVPLTALQIVFDELVRMGKIK